MCSLTYKDSGERVGFLNVMGDLMKRTPRRADGSLQPWTNKTGQSRVRHDGGGSVLVPGVGAQKNTLLGG